MHHILQVYTHLNVNFILHDPNVLFQPLLMKILKHIWRVLSTHSGPYQGLNMITTDCQNCLNNFHFLNTIFTFSTQLFAKKDYKSMAASLSLVTLVSPCQWMAATASILAKISSVWRKKRLSYMDANSLLCDLSIYLHPRWYFFQFFTLM